MRAMDRRRAAERTGCGQAAEWGGIPAERCDRTEPKLWAEERNRGLEKATKFGVSFRYLGLRVAPMGLGVNAYGKEF